MKITSARLRGREGLWTIQVGETIESIVPAGKDSPTVDNAAGGETFDAGGALVTGQFAENHIHLDYAYSAGTPRENKSGTLFEAIDIWADRKRGGHQNHDGIKANALAAAKSAVSYGMGFIRTHVDVTDPDLTAFYALRELREEIADWVDLQLVAFPQNGIFAFEGGAALMERAMAEGADVVGGIPHLEPSYELGTESVRFIFDLAEKYDARVDVHCDEIDDVNSRFIDDLTNETRARGMQGRVTAGHAVAMGYYPPGYMARLLPKLVEADMAFAIAPNENLQLQGRDMAPPVPRGVAPIKQLVDAGLSVAFCQDSISDPWYPVGVGDPVRNLDSGLHVGHMLGADYLDRALDFIQVNPSRNLGVSEENSLIEGGPANLLVLDAQSDRDVVRFHPTVLLSIHNGKEVFRAQPASYTWSI